MTAPFTLTDLTAALRAAAGLDEDLPADDRILDVPLTDLGIDSLAMLEFASQLRRRHGVALDDRDIDRMGTPRDALDAVNQKLVGV